MLIAQKIICYMDGQMTPIILGKSQSKNAEENKASARRTPPLSL